jgi:ribosome-associated protein
VSLVKSEVEWRFSASGGPGGQHVNTSNTKAEAVFDVEPSTLPGWAKQRLLKRLGPTVSVTASDTRSQSRNRDLALDRLAEKLREGLKPPPPPRRATKPSKAATARRLDEKRHRGETKTQRRRPTADD